MRPRLTCLLLALSGLGCARSASRDAVVVALAQAPAELLPYRSNDDYSNMVLGNVFEPLVDVDADLEFQPGLAESWHTPDDLTWVFKLRSGVRFHDGTPLSARDAAASIEAARSAPDSKLRAELTAVAAVEVTAVDTLVIRTRHPFAPLPNRLVSIQIFRRAADPRGWPSGTGPYRIERYAPQAGITLVAWDGYRGTPPPIRRLDFRVVADARRQVDQLSQGQVQLVADVPIELEDAVRSSTPARLLARKGVDVMYLAMDCAREHSPYLSAARNPFRDVRARRALALAIDRHKLVSVALGGAAEVADQIVAPEAFGYHEDLARWPFDPEQARRLLAEAGHPAGFEVTLDSVGIEGAPPTPTVAAIMAGLTEIGIRIKTRPQTLGALLRRVEARDTSLYLLDWIGTSGDAGSTAEYLLHTPRGGYGLDNGGNYSNPDLDRLLEAASGQLDVEERRATLRSAASLIHEQVPVVPLYRRTDAYGVARELTFKPRLDKQIRGAEMRLAP